MTPDVAVADALVWIAAHGVAVMALGILLLSASLALWSPGLHLLTENRRLRRDLEEARRKAAVEESRATFAVKVAAGAHARVLDLQEGLKRVEKALQRIHAEDVLAQLELETEWEVDAS